MINTMIRRFIAGAVAGFALLASLSILTITNASGAYADSTVDGQITQSEVIARAWDWVNRRPYIKYDSSGRTSYPDVAGKQYRPDCSGAVSMAWHVGTSYNTSTLPSAPKVRLIAADPSSSTDLRTGDLLNVSNGPNGEHHAVLFDQWEADHVHFSVFSFGGGSDGSTPPQHETGRTFSGSVGGHPGSIYSAYRYDNVLPDTLVSDSEQLQFADMNNDRVADLISMRANGDVVAYWNVGGIFNGSNKLVAGGFKEPARTRFADMNNDGVADLISMRANGDVVVYWNVGGVFNGSNKLVASGFTDSVGTKFADMNNDGVADLISMRANGDVVVYWNVGGVFNGTNKLVAGGFKEPAATRFADMNNDRLPDLISIRANGDVVVYWNVGGVFSGNKLVASGFTDPARTKFADMNNDGVADLISVRGNGDVVVYWNVGGVFNGTNKLVATGFII